MTLPGKPRFLEIFVKETPVQVQEMADRGDGRPELPAVPHTLRQNELGLVCNPKRNGKCKTRKPSKRKHEMLSLQTWSRQSCLGYGDKKAQGKTWI